MTANLIQAVSVNIPLSNWEICHSYIPRGSHAETNYLSLYKHIFFVKDWFWDSTLLPTFGYRDCAKVANHTSSKQQCWHGAKHCNVSKLFNTISMDDVRCHWKYLRNIMRQSQAFRYKQEHSIQSNVYFACIARKKQPTHHRVYQLELWGTAHRERGLLSETLLLGWYQCFKCISSRC